ncbi:hypothetical protein ACFWZ6_34995 [Streptomyces massasporeus]
MTPGTERAMVISGVTANVLSAAGVLASAADKLPASVLPAAVMIFGCTGLYLLHRFLPSGSAAAARRAVVATTLVLVLIVAYWASNFAWPGNFPLGRQAGETDAKTKEGGPTSGATSASFARGLKVTEPKKLARIGTCAEVVGTGQIPEGYQVWAAHLRDREGVADTTGLYNLHRASEANDGEWSTGLFGVGTDADVGKDFWIYVYLVPDSVGSVVENLIKPEGWNPSLSAPIVDTDPFAEIPIHRVREQTC